MRHIDRSHPQRAQHPGQHLVRADRGLAPEVDEHLPVGEVACHREPTKLIGDTSIRAGNVTTEVKNGTATSKRYTGDQLTDITVGGATGKYWYDDWGNLDCLTLAAGSKANCSPSDGSAASSNLITDYGYDYLNRLTNLRHYGSGTRTDKTTYTYDAVDRTTKEVEDHTGTGTDRTTAFTYQGLTSLATEERQTGGTDPRTKTFSYDSYGHRIAMTDKATGSTTEPNKYTYSVDVHSSVSQLIDDAGNVKASYGYNAYGGADSPSSDPQSLTTGNTGANPINPYRYSGKRIDTGTTSTGTTPSPVPNGSGGYDMGARRYGPDTASFLQQDMFHGSLANLGLALDPLTQTRYAMAGGNPISYIETDGHLFIADGGGGGSTTTESPEPSGGEDTQDLGTHDPGPTVDWSQAWDTAKSALNPADYTNLGWASAGLGISGATNERSGKEYETWKADQAAKFLAKQKNSGPAPSFWRHPLKRAGWQLKDLAYGIYNDHQQYRANSALAKGSKWQGRLSKAGKGFGFVGALVAGADAGMNKWYRDRNRPGLSTTERVGRAVISGGTTALGSFGGGAAGAWAVGAATSWTGPGAVAGAAGGAAIGGWVGGGLGTAGGDVLGDLWTEAVDW
ncbi:hypothetical protein [Micromonospora sicca]|uniref:hypothetical protein n=1 Tax=Micromonospora sicca TaxID=2202420 RepID=UPI0013753549|nr:hypothetical protein [Micromonospora sp. 4G51]